ncbi:MAG: methyltransferase domain-containing protein [Planctomycetes bacterium]|nr:methyltransferase domain-containing protein [Planctomycetota bacterium]
MEKSHSKEEVQNLNHWDAIAPVHYNAYYIKPLFEPDGICLDDIQVNELGDISGKSLLHLQCHIGTDTLSLVRLGAEVTGVDFSEKSIELARQLSQETGIKARFIHSNIYDLQDKLNEQFDFVYTSQGVLCWLRDINEWGRIVARHLKPGGTFYIMESHPIRHIFDDEASEDLKVIHKYAPDTNPTLWEGEHPDYADKSFVVKSSTYEWSWTVSDILNSLINAGMQVEFFNEYSKLFFKGFPWMTQDEEGWWILPGHEDHIPLTFTIKCTKKA